MADALPDPGAFRPDEMFASAQVGLAELALSGRTLISGHLYLSPIDLPAVIAAQNRLAQRLAG